MTSIRTDLRIAQAMLDDLPERLVDEVGVLFDTGLALLIAEAMVGTIRMGLQAELEAARSKLLATETD